MLGVVRLRIAVFVVAAACAGTWMLASPPTARAGATFVVRANAAGLYQIFAAYEILRIQCALGYLMINQQYVQLLGTQVADPVAPMNLQPQVPCDKVEGVVGQGTDGDDLFSLIVDALSVWSSGGVFIGTFDSPGRDRMDVDLRNAGAPAQVEASQRIAQDPQMGPSPYSLVRIAPLSRSFGFMAGLAQGQASLPPLAVTFGSSPGLLNAAAYTAPVIATGGVGRDRLIGGRAADRLNGGGGNDMLTGGAGNDVLNGGAGNDASTGGAGNDVFDGGPGRDSANGGPGRDRARRVEVRRGIP